MRSFRRRLVARLCLVLLLVVQVQPAVAASAWTTLQPAPAPAEVSSEETEHPAECCCCCCRSEATDPSEDSEEPVPACPCKSGKPGCPDGCVHCTFVKAPLLGGGSCRLTQVPEMLGFSVVVLDLHVPASPLEEHFQPPRA